MINSIRRTRPTIMSLFQISYNMVNNILPLNTKVLKAFIKTDWKNINHQKRNTINNDHLKSKNEIQVYIVGAGAGDIDLLTLKAIKVIEKADVIMVDYLVNPEIYQFFPKNAERIFVGKKCGQHSMKQADICDLMVEQALQGKTVVRLKGGDPSIFGRLAEETAALSEHNILFNIVPGITAASGCAAYSGIPLTHRDCAQAVKFVTAHLKDVDDECNWQQLAKESDTLVFYMGLNRVAKIASRLIEHGMNSDMPIAVIDQGTSIDQQVFSSTLLGINPASDLANFKGPALIIVGKVVEHRVDVTLSNALKNTLTCGSLIENKCALN